MLVNCSAVYRCVALVLLFTFVCLRMTGFCLGLCYLVWLLFARFVGVYVKLLLWFCGCYLLGLLVGLLGFGVLYLI